MIRFKYIILLLILCYGNAFAVDLEITISHEMENGKVYIKGNTNLPEGTKVGIKISDASGTYSAQSYNRLVDKDGKFKSEGFASKGRKLTGKFIAEVIAYRNKAWQSKDILDKLETYKGYGIEEGNIEFTYNFTVTSPAYSSADTNLNGNKKKHAKLVSGFCYALQASMICDGLKMRVDTEAKVEKEVGEKIRGTKSPYNQACLSGLNKAFEDENRRVCSNAWGKYGCYGSEVPRLIQENPFKKRNGIFCEY